MVEDLIQESMTKGEFSNLRGSGKPLKYQNYNPFVDIVTQKINQVCYSCETCSSYKIKRVVFFVFRF